MSARNDYSGRSVAINSSTSHSLTWGDIWIVNCYHCKASFAFWELHSSCPCCGKPVEKPAYSRGNQMMSQKQDRR